MNPVPTPDHHEPGGGAPPGPTSTITAPREMDAPLGSPSRPTWRGRLHLITLWSALPMLVLLVIHADGAGARAGVIVYAVGLCAMLAVSTTYHRWVHTVRARRMWRRADHATIFAAIGGTFTALAMVSLGTGLAITMMIMIWTAAVGGAAVQFVKVPRSDRIGVILYIAIGWAGLILVPALWMHGGPLPVGLLIGGGLMYTVGAIGFGRRWPTLRPSTFSYHEVWHAFTVAAAGLHFAAVWVVAA
jgi:hemolysin III